MRFWVVSALAAAVLAAATAAVVPLVTAAPVRSGAVWLLRPSELWLLAVFTEGVLAVLTGATAMGGWWVGASGLKEALDRWTRNGRERSAHPLPDGEPGQRARGGSRGAAWLTVVGAWLLVIYGGGWLVLFQAD
jgi:hypothetical protein